MTNLFNFFESLDVQIKIKNGPAMLLLRNANDLKNKIIEVCVTIQTK